MKKLLLLIALALTSGCYTIEPQLRENFNKARDIIYLEEYREQAQTPYKTETMGKGNCLDKAVYLKYLLEEHNYKSNVRVGTYQYSKPHAWLQMEHKGRKIILDPTVDFFGQDTRGDFADLTEFYLNLNRLNKK